jgi:hypothetical protein
MQGIKCTAHEQWLKKHEHLTVSDGTSLIVLRERRGQVYHITCCCGACNLLGPPERFDAVRDPAVDHHDDDKWHVVQDLPVVEHNDELGKILVLCNIDL